MTTNAAFPIQKFGHIVLVLSLGGWVGRERVGREGQGSSNIYTHLNIEATAFTLEH